MKATGENEESHAETRSSRSQTRSQIGHVLSQEQNVNDMQPNCRHTNLLISIEALALPAVALFGWLYPMVWRNAGCCYYGACVLAAVAAAHGLAVVLRRRDWPFFWASLALAFVFLALSFLPIWYAHAAPAPGGWERHAHMFWSWPHMH